VISTSPLPSRRHSSAAAISRNFMRLRQIPSVPQEEFGESFLEPAAAGYLKIFHFTPCKI
jgi:hypothetical protein